MKKSLLSLIFGIIITQFAISYKTSAQTDYRCSSALLNNQQNVSANVICRQNNFLKENDSLTIKINVFFTHLSNGTGIYDVFKDTTNPLGYYPRLAELISKLNYNYSHLDNPTCPINADTLITDTRVRFELKNVFHINDDAKYKISGTNESPLYSEVDANQNTLNLFFVGNGDASTYPYNNTYNWGWVNLQEMTPHQYGNAIFMKWVKRDTAGTESFVYQLSGLLAHETGHALGLIHTFKTSPTCTDAGDDNIDDTYAPDPGEWTSQPGNGNHPILNDGTICYNINCVPNNIMGYTGRNEGYFSPNQIYLLQLTTKSRPYVDWSKSHVSSSGIIEEDFIVDNQVISLSSLDLRVKKYKSITIKNGGRLTVTGCLNMATEGYITVEAGPNLLNLNGATISCDSGMWFGIQVLG